MNPLLDVRDLRKTYRRGRGAAAFSLEANFQINAPQIIGVMGPNGSGKTTLFELLTGSNTPDAGSVWVAGKNIHRVRTDERDRLAIHYHQSYQVRRFRSRLPNFLLERAESAEPSLHLFDEPQLSPQDGYLDFAAGFFLRLKARGKLVFICLHPTETHHLALLRELCDTYVFVQNGRLTQAADWAALNADARVAEYLGVLHG